MSCHEVWGGWQGGTERLGAGSQLQDQGRGVNQQMFTSHGSGGWESTIKVLAHLVPVCRSIEGWGPGLRAKLQQWSRWRLGDQRPQMRAVAGTQTVSEAAQSCYPQNRIQRIPQGSKDPGSCSLL